MNSWIMLRRITYPAVCIALASTMAGCSQIDALAPVSGGPLQTVRVGVFDVLVKEQVQILVAPVCVEEATQFTCLGSTIDGAQIKAEATLTKPYQMTITIGNETLYDGDVQTIIDEAARVTP